MLLQNVVFFDNKCNPLNVHEHFSFPLFFLLENALHTIRECDKNWFEKCQFFSNKVLSEKTSFGLTMRKLTISVENRWMGSSRRKCLLFEWLLFLFSFDALLKTISELNPLMDCYVFLLYWKHLWISVDTKFEFELQIK